MHLDCVKGWWVDELYHVLWTYHTTQRTSTGETPFNLAFRIEAIIPLEVGLPSLQAKNFDENNNSK